MLNFNADLIRANIIAMQQAQQAKKPDEAKQEQQKENKLPSNNISAGEVQDLMSVHSMYVRTMVNGVNNVDTVEIKKDKPTEIPTETSKNKPILGSLTGLIQNPELEIEDKEALPAVKTKWSKHPPMGVKSTPDGEPYVNGDTWIVKGNGYREIYEMHDNEWIKMNTITTSINNGGIWA